MDEVVGAGITGTLARYPQVTEDFSLLIKITPEGNADRAAKGNENAPDRFGAAGGVR